MSGEVRLMYFIVDAFTQVPFTGNSAAVVPLSKWPADEWLQGIAREMNLSETAFLVPTEVGYQLRWFTPTVEVDLCGHATLATAKVLAHLGSLPDRSVVAFSTRSGVLKALRHGEVLELDFPSQAAKAAAEPAELAKSLGISPRFVGFNGSDYLVEVDSEQLVRSLAPDFRQLAQICCRGVIVTAPSEDSRFDFVSRFFAPAAGIDEDPVTGSAHCCLGPYWGSKLQKRMVVGRQVSSRGGVVQVMMLSGERVRLRGDAVIVAQGEFSKSVLEALVAAGEGSFR